MATTEVRTTPFTSADLHALLGDMPLARVRFDRPPGTATEDDVVDLQLHEDRLCELADGVLMEKTVGWYESYLALYIAGLLSNFARANKLGFAAGADGMTRLAPGLVRIPDASFFSWHRFPERKLPRGAFVDMAPDLVVEVIRPSNTRREMDRKLQEYFRAGARLVWYTYPTTKTVRVFVRPDEGLEFAEDQVLDGGDVLPGFTLVLRDFFAEPA